MKFKHVTLILFTILIVYLIYLSSRSVFVNNTVTYKQTNFVLFGVDAVEDALHSDTVILLSYSSSCRLLDVVSIPRDVYIDIETFKFRKLTEIFAYFYRQKKDKKYAAEKVKEVLENKVFCVGNNKINIHYFLVIDYTNFEKLMNLLGKIKITVTEPMHYDDFAGNLHIHFEPGVYYMDGKQLLQYVRYRDSVGDLGRITRQQNFVKSVLARVLSPECWYKMPMLVYNFRKCFITNINLWEFINILLEFKNLRFTDLRFSVLPCRPKGRYLEVEESTKQAFLNYLENKQLSTKCEHVLFKIYNASGKEKLAKQLTYFMRDKGYDVLEWGNWYCKQPKSRIIDYTHDVKTVKAICDLLNIYDVTSAYPQEGASVDMQSTIVIILGEDFVLPQN